MNKEQRGFTLLEMMVAIAVVAILVSFGLPNFRDFIRNARMSAAANDVLADVNLARSESIKRRVAVTLCKSANGTSCDVDETTQFRGWIVFVDDADAAIENATNDGNATVDTDEIILRARSVSPEIDDAVATGLFAVFTSSGFVRPGATNLQQVLFCDARKNAVSIGGDSAARGVTISATGRAVVTRNPEIIQDQLGGCPT